MAKVSNAPYGAAAATTLVVGVLLSDAVDSLPLVFFLAIASGLAARWVSAFALMTRPRRIKWHEHRAEAMGAGYEAIEVLLGGDGSILGSILEGLEEFHLDRLTSLENK